MANNVGDNLHCEEQLRTTLQCDDKDKLRRKLLLLQREYLRTAQRLQRAERSEAVRRHVRSRITQQNEEDQRNAEITSNSPVSLTLNTTNGTSSSARQCDGNTEGPAESENPRRSQVIRFLLPTDDACQQTPDYSHGAAKGHRPSPALRLRSHRSRLRWERKSAEAGKSTDNREEGQEQNERMEPARTEGSEERVKTEQTKVADESEELFSGTESESPSLLLTHWNNCGQTERGDINRTEIQGGQKQSEKETEGKRDSRSVSVQLPCCNSAIDSEVTGPVATQNGSKVEDGGEEGENREQRDGDSSNKDTVQNTAEKKESDKDHDKTAEIREEESKMVGGENEKGASLLDSCTLVEGLLFPAEYYVRTTRRMTSSQSQPHMEAVILSQLNVGRQRRRRGSGRGLDRHTLKKKVSDQQSRTDFSLMTASPSVGPHMESQATDTSELSSQSGTEVSHQISACQIDADSVFSPTVATGRPTRRGRRRRRGRGRGGLLTPRCSLTLDSQQPALGQTTNDPQATSSPDSSFLSLHEADGSKQRLTQEEAVLVPEDPHYASTRSAATQPSSGGSEAQSSSGQPVYPIFLKSRAKTARPTQMSRSTTSWRSLLLPSSPAAQTSLLPLPSLPSGSLVNGLMNFEIAQDFHLPDEQFASLKLHKLRQVALESGVEGFASPSYCTRRSIRRSQTCNEPVISLPLPLNLTPTISNSASSSDSKQTSSQHVDLQNVSIDHELEDKLKSRSLAEELSDRDANQETENLQPECLAHSSSTESVSVVQDCAAESVDQYEEPGSEILNAHSSLQKTPVEPSNNCTAPAECPVQHLDVRSPAEESNESTKATTSPPRGKRNQDECSLHRSVQSQLLLSPPPASAPFITPHLRSSALPSSPILPSLGLTPYSVSATLPLTSSPSAPPLTLPPPHSPSIQALSPPALSPCPSPISIPSQPSQRTEPATGPTVSSTKSQDSGGQVRLQTEETAEERMMKCTHTLKAPAGGTLVDACCILGSSGGLCLAAAGKWAVCLWSQTPASDWSLTHTWVFSEPVINVFPVPDAAGLMCVTLGQLEISEVRMLTCSSLLNVLLCDGLVQAVVGVSKSRVVVSSHSASGSTLQVFLLSDTDSTPSSQLLVSPGVCVGALAPVNGLSDALIGTDEGGRLFVWNLNTGQLLKRVTLGDGLSHTACLSGYSHCGVLFVLLQHQLLSSLEEEARQATATDQMCLEEEKEEKTITLFSLVAINPLSGRSALAARLCPPKAWSGRLCEADIHGCSVVGLSQSGCVCVWELGRRGASRMVRAPESEGWQLARWGVGGTLLTGHHSGDVTLHCNRNSHTSL